MSEREGPIHVEPILDALREYLRSHPDQRVGQAIINLTRNGQGRTQEDYLFNMEDGVLYRYFKWQRDPRKGFKPE